MKENTTGPARQEQKKAEMKTTKVVTTTAVQSVVTVPKTAPTRQNKEGKIKVETKTTKEVVPKTNNTVVKERETTKTKSAVIQIRRPLATKN